MPFTFSHPALVLPFSKVKSDSVCLSALILGSMIPDFQYFIAMKLNGRFSHTLGGVFLFDLPVAILVLIIFHGLVKKPLLDNLPGYFSSRLAKLKSFNFWQYSKQHPIGLVLCILIGTASHLVWDGFTHSDGMFTGIFPGLLQVIDVNGLPELPVYRYLQHISSVIGAIAILIVFHKMPAEDQQTKPDLRFWTVLTFFSVLALVIRMSFGVEYYGDMVTILISSGLVGLILASAVMKFGWNRM